MCTWYTVYYAELKVQVNENPVTQPHKLMGGLKKYTWVTQWLIYVSKVEIFVNFDIAINDRSTS